MINRRQFIKWTGYMIGAAAVAPSVLIAPKVPASLSSASGASRNYRGEAKLELAEWMSQKWSEAIYKEATRKSYFPIFTGKVGKYDGVILKLA